MAISGDFAVVGAGEHNNNLSDTGAAYVFQRSGTDWTQQEKLTPDDTAAGDRFGLSVSISGDYIIVGAPFSNPAGLDAGAAYVFVRSGSTWSQQSKLTADDAAANDFFGASVSISGNLALIGAYGDDDNGSSSGAAYIFNRSESSWTHLKKLIPTDGAQNDFFGFSVSISDTSAIVGAFADDDRGSSSGSAYTFKNPEGTWIQDEKLTADDGTVDDFFGISVSTNSSCAIMGTTGCDDLGSGSGSAYLFQFSIPKNRTSASWLPLLLSID